MKFDQIGTWNVGEGLTDVQWKKLIGSFT